MTNVEGGEHHARALVEGSREPEEEISNAKTPKTKERAEKSQGEAERGGGWDRWRAFSNGHASESAATTEAETDSGAGGLGFLGRLGIGVWNLLTSASCHAAVEEADEGVEAVFVGAGDAGAKVALPSPGYPCYRHILTALGQDAVLLSTGDPTRWMPVGSDIDDAVREERLRKRHQQFGRSAEAARDWVAATDAPNARLIAATRGRAHHVLHWS